MKGVLVRSGGAALSICPSVDQKVCPHQAFHKELQLKTLRSSNNETTGPTPMYPQIDGNNTYCCSDERGGGIHEGQSGTWFQKLRKQHLLLQVCKAGGGGVGTRPGWLALLACGSAYLASCP